MKRKQKYMAAFVVLILNLLTLGSFITKADAKEVITTRIINYTQGTQPPESGKTNEPGQSEIPSQSNETEKPPETGQTEEANKNTLPEQAADNKKKEQTEEQEQTEEEKQTEEPKEEEPAEEQENDDTDEDLPKEYTGYIKLDVKELSLKQGDTYQLKATLTSDNKTDSKLSYKTSNVLII